ncbi:MAG: hypothetical protein AAGA88_02825 [Pseudomonadota bacterium]
MNASKTLAAVAILAVASIGVADAGQRIKPKSPVKIGVVQIPNGQHNTVPDGSYGGKNKADAWTQACIDEFGPGANYPDEDMLQNCLNYGS